MTELKRLPLTVQTAYADLLARLQEDSILEIGGTPIIRERNGKKYWYTVKRSGTKFIEKYLGPDTDSVRLQVERSRKVNEDLRDREKQRTALVRMCRGGGLPSTDAVTGKVLHALSNAGLFRLRGVLVGTHAFRCYPGLLGVAMPEAIAVTEDIDIAAFRPIAVAIDDRLDPALAETLNQVGHFLARPSLNLQPTAWREKETGALVELLTPNQGPETDEPVELPAFGAYAQPLRFLDFLIHEPVQAAMLYRSGLLANVPQPARYAVHKLIVATRRASTSAVKARKDIEQAASLIGLLLEDRPDEIEDALAEAKGRGPAWSKAIASGAGRLPNDIQAALKDRGLLD